MKQPHSQCLGKMKDPGNEAGREIKHYRFRQVRDYRRYPPAEMNSKQFEKRNYRDKINPLSFVKLRDQFNGKEAETFWLRIDRASQSKVSKCVHLLNVFVNLFES